MKHGRYFMVRSQGESEETINDIRMVINFE
jgi:hypothetical protein